MEQEKRTALLKAALNALNSINDLDPTGDQWRECTRADALCQIVGVPIWDALGINYMPAVDEAKKLIEEAINCLEQENNRLVQPSMDMLIHWIRDGISEAACPERCIVEPDGYCPHDKPSWMLVMGLI